MANATEPTATHARLELGRMLKTLRTRNRMSVEQVVLDRTLGYSRAKLYKAEAGKHASRVPDIKALGAFYQATPEEMDKLVGLALGTADEDWWHVHGSDAAPRWFSLYLAVEPRAQLIRTYQGELVPGLLQTPGYATAVYVARNPDDDPEEVRARVALRIERQERILNRQDLGPPTLDVLLSEAVLRRVVGGPAVMAEQVAQLQKAAQRPNVRIRVVRFDAGAHAAMEAAFVILDFAGDPSIVYIENPSSAAYLQKAGELQRYEKIFAQVQAQATPIEEWSL